MLVTIKEAAKELSLSVTHCRKMIRLGRWPFYRLGSSNKGIRIDPNEIREVARQPAESEKSNGMLGRNDR